MTSIVSWEAWSAAEQAWKAQHPIPGRRQGWRQRMLDELGEQFGGAARPSPPANPYTCGTECEACKGKLIEGSCAQDGTEVAVCPECGLCDHGDWYHERPAGEPGGYLPG